MGTNGTQAGNFATRTRYTANLLEQIFKMMFIFCMIHGKTEINVTFINIPDSFRCWVGLGLSPDASVQRQ